MRQNAYRNRIISLLVTFMIILPILALSVFAGSSPRVSFGFNFNGHETTMVKNAQKTDVGEDSDYYAGLTVNNYEVGLSTSRVRFYIADADGVSLVDPIFVSSTGHYTFFYIRDRLNDMPNNNVQLRGVAYDAVWGVGGYFQP